MSRFLFAFALVMALGVGPAFADGDDDGHPEHVSSLGALRVVHAWTRATGADEALVFADVENGLDDEVTLTGAATAIASRAELVGLENRDGALALTPLPQVPIGAGRELELSPDGLAVRLTGLAAPLEEGDHFELELAFDRGTLEVEVEVEAADATQHGHAGHQH